jgi:NTP pyrophosphatase (non-canonical NTP hydrolase)
VGQKKLDSLKNSSVSAPSIFHDYVEELSNYRAERNKPSNCYHYIVKATEELGEVAEALLAVNGQRDKVKKITMAGSTPRGRLLEECGDVINTIMLLCHDNYIDAGMVIGQALYKLNNKRVSKE